MLCSRDAFVKSRTLVETSCRLYLHAFHGYRQSGNKTKHRFPGAAAHICNVGFCNRTRTPPECVAHAKLGIWYRHGKHIRIIRTSLLFQCLLFALVGILHPACALHVSRGLVCCAILLLCMWCTYSGSCSVNVSNASTAKFLKFGLRRNGWWRPTGCCMDKDSLIATRPQPSDQGQCYLSSGTHGGGTGCCQHVTSRCDGYLQSSSQRVGLSANHTPHRSS